MASDSGSGQASLTQIQLSVALLKAREAGVPFHIGWQTSLLKHINVALASAPAPSSGSGQANVHELYIKLKAAFSCGANEDARDLLNAALATAPAVDRAGVLEEARKELVSLVEICHHREATDGFSATQIYKFVREKLEPIIRALAHQPVEPPVMTKVPIRPIYYVRHPDDSYSVAEPQPPADAGKELRAKVNDLPQIRYVSSGDDTEPSGYYVPLDAVLALLGGRDKELRAKVEALLEMDCEDEAYQAGYQTAVKAVLALLGEGEG